MTVKERTSVRLNKIVQDKLNKNYPNVNLSLLLNNTLGYILDQDEEIIKDFITKKV